MDRKWGIFIILFLFFTTLAGAATNASTATWSTVLLDASKQFFSQSSRCIAVDGNGNPHIEQTHKHKASL